jgi:hypothetical protein
LNLKRKSPAPLGTRTILRLSRPGLPAALLAFLLLLVACAPTQPAEVALEKSRTSPIASGTTNTSPPPSQPAANTGCSAAVVTPEDALCYLATADPSQVQRINDETVVLLADPQSIAGWAGAAIIYHIPTSSTLVLDQFGDGDPQASTFSSRAGLAALSEVAGNTELMASLKQQLQLKWPSAPASEPEIRLGTAWQDGPTTVFFIAVAGLEATDERFYCPGQTWIIGDDTVEILSDCMAREAGAPVNHFLFEAKTIKGNRERPVQVALDGAPSNVVPVREGPVAQETLIYQAALQQIAHRPLILHEETVPGFDNEPAQLVEAMDPALLQNYLAENKTPYSLRFLFQGSSAYFVTPDAAIARDYGYPPDSEPQQACTQFRRDYPGLGGIATLSRIGLSDSGAQALVHVLYECGPDDRLANYYTLAKSGGGWQVTESFAAAANPAVLTPEMAYVNKASGCGDIFVYKSNREKSEFVKVSIETRALPLSREPVTLDLAAQPEIVGAWIDVYVDSVEKLGENPYCNDTGPTAEPWSVWQAVSGTVTVSAPAGVQTEPCAGEPYQVNLLLEDVVFSLGEEAVLMPALSFEDVTVGWCAG